MLFSDDLSCHPRHQLWIKNWLNKSFHSKFSKFCPWIQLNPTGIQLFLPPAPTWVQICGSGETSASLHTPSLTLHSAKCPHLCPNFPNFAFFKTHIIWFSFLAFFTIISDDYQCVHQTTHWWNGTWYRYKLKDKTNCVWSWRFAISAGINWIWHKRTIFKFYGRIADNSILGFCLWIRGTRIGVSSHGIFLKKTSLIFQEASIVQWSVNSWGRLEDILEPLVSGVYRHVATFASPRLTWGSQMCKYLRRKKF